MEPVSVEFLQSIEALKNVPVTQLQWLIDHSIIRKLEEGQFLFEEDDPISGMHIVISGRIRIFFIQGSGYREVATLEPREITGYLPYSRGKVAGATGQALTEVLVMTYPIEKAHELIREHFELTQALVHVMTDRVRTFTALQQQNEKMMALGKLSAGLAHELNNPASAIVRSSTLLKSHLRMQPDTFKEVIAIRMTPEQVDAVNEHLFDVMKREHTTLSLMERTSREDDMVDCLEEHHVANAYEVAENFVDFGFNCEDIERFKSAIPESFLSPVFNWINNNLVTEKMVADISDASERIASLVTSVKNFTHMDRGHDKQYFDIHSGIRNTLTMLNHKLKKNAVEVVEHYDESLPQVKAMVGELNQVWTNLIDNAIDAMEGRENSKLEIKTEKNGIFVKVSVTDNGPGIPAEIKSQIFDPFFTTKEIGKGTGLGLDVVNRIVLQHNGSIKVNSEPGKTVFIVCFPIDGK